MPKAGQRLDHFGFQAKVLTNKEERKRGGGRDRDGGGQGAGRRRKMEAH